MWRLRDQHCGEGCRQQLPPPRLYCSRPVNHSPAPPFPDTTMDGLTRPPPIGELGNLRSASKRCYEDGSRHGLPVKHYSPGPVLRLTGLSEIRLAHRRDAVQ